MRVEATPLPGVLLVEPRLFADARGRFFESWNAERYAGAGIAGPFVQDNVSVSRRGVLRGLHHQHPRAQGKLVSVLRGEVWDVAADVRRGSPAFGRWFGCALSEENARQLWIPPGFAHGFVVLSGEAVFAYKCTDYYRPECERTIAWDDPDLAIDWPVADPILSEKDRQGVRLREMPADQLPPFENAA